MIAVKIYGGLGNQLFQYATGYALSKRLGCPLTLDLDHYKQNNFRSFELSSFEAPYEIYDNKQHGVAVEKGLLGSCSRALVRFCGNTTLEKVREKHFHFNETLRTLSKSAYIDGYWQSERYFQGYKEELRKILKLKTTTSFDSKLAQKILGKNSVALHIRRSDYQLKENQKLFHLCSLDYYKSAVRHLKKFVPEAHYFLFSDDHKWLEESFGWLSPKTIVKSSSALEDFYLMQKAKHHIIANSTFSWWAAWLAYNEEQKVVAPLEWFKLKEKNTKDLIPKNWIQL